MEINTDCVSTKRWWNYSVLLSINSSLHGCFVVSLKTHLKWINYMILIHKITQRNELENMWNVRILYHVKILFQRLNRATEENNPDVCIGCYCYNNQNKTKKLRRFSPLANYTDRATAACRRS
jgi:hypothetical protein